MEENNGQILVAEQTSFVFYLFCRELCEALGYDWELMKNWTPRVSFKDWLKEKDIGS